MMPAPAWDRSMVLRLEGVEKNPRPGDGDVTEFTSQKSSTLANPTATLTVRGGSGWVGGTFSFRLCF